MQGMKTAAVVVTVGAALSACGQGGTPVAQTTATVTQTVTVTATPSPSTASASPSATATPSPSSTSAPAGGTLNLAVGKTATFDSGLKATLLQTKDPVRSIGAESGNRWVGALVKTCVPVDSELSWGPWLALDADSGQYPASGTVWGDAPRPQYPVGGATTKAGQCAKGWLLIEVPKGTTVTKIGYSVDDGTASWRLK